MNTKNRIYNDFFMPIRVVEYERLLAFAKENGYEFHTLRSFAQISVLDPCKKYIILRRDVDTSANRIQWAMLRAEINNGARCSSYFRKNTANKKLMRQIEEHGGEASYHYEEIATWCYKHRVRRKEEVLEHLDEFQSMFAQNVELIREKYGVPVLTVSSHGEYVNRKLDVDNKIIASRKVLDKCGIIIDAYDEGFKQKCIARIHDHDRDNFVADVRRAISAGVPVIEILTHPRQWGASFFTNLLDDVNRFFKQIYMNL